MFNKIGLPSKNERCKRYKKVINKFFEACAQEGIEESDIRLWMEEDDLKYFDLILKIKNSEDDCYLNEQEYKYIKSLLEKIKLEFDVNFNFNDSKKYPIFLNIVNIILLGFVIYIVVSSLWINSGYRIAKFGFNIILLVILLIWIWILEGLQMSLGQIRHLEISSKDNTLINVQNKIKSDEGMWRFLSGRQLLVVILVFFVARLTTVQSVEKFPFINIPVSGYIPVLVVKLFWNLGIGGALLTLWLAQLFSQSVATSYPVKFSRFFLVPIVIKITDFFDNFTLPGKWLRNILIKRDMREEIPLYINRMYFESSKARTIYTIQTLKRLWIYRNGEERLVVQFHIVVSHPTITIPLSLVIFKTPKGMKRVGYVKLPNYRKINIHYEDESSSTGINEYKFRLEPSDGGVFKKGENIFFEVYYIFQRSIQGSDGFYINEPIKHLFFMLIDEDKNLSISNVKIKKERIDHFEKREDTIYNHKTINEKIIYYLYANYPAPYYYYNIEWSVEYRSI